jgi:hypothetical protein
MSRSIKKIPSSITHQVMQVIMYFLSLILSITAIMSIYMYTVWNEALPEAMKHPGSEVWFLNAEAMSRILLILPVIFIFSVLCGQICFTQALQ